MDEGFELADVIRQVRSELALAMQEGESKDLKFRLGAVELDLELAVGRSLRPDAKLRLVVLDLGASLERTNAVTHRIKLVLHPRLANDPDAEPWISGPVAEGEE